MTRPNHDDQALHDRPTMTMEQIDAAISDIARNGTGPDRFKALALLRKSEHTPRESYLAPPMTEGEAVERMARLIKATGGEVARAAYRRALPKERRPIDDPEPAGIEHLPAETVAMIEEKVRDLKSLYRIAPELKRPGRYSGFPISKGPLERQRWCQMQAKRYFADKLNLAPAGAQKSPVTVTPDEADQVRSVPTVRSQATSPAGE